MNPGQLGDPVHQVRHRGAKALGDVVVGGVGVLDAVVEEGGLDGLAVQPHLRHDLRHVEGVGDIGGAVPAHLVAVVGLGVVKGGADLLEVRGDVVAGDGLFQMLVALFHSGHG